jgi:eukaryotic-like serine/threonine-protein kinase
VVYAEDARFAATQLLDEYAARWVDLHTRICEATRLQGDQSETLMDLRIGCLHAKMRDVAALTTVLSNADADVVKNAVQAVQSLPSPDVCATMDSGEADLLQPEDPAVRSRVDSVRELVARARAEVLSGKYDDAFVHARSAHAAALDVGYEAAIAEAALMLGNVYERKVTVEPALAAYEEAIASAAASGHTLVEVQALTGLLLVHGMHLVEIDTALRYARQAEAMVKRLGDPPELQAAIYLHRGGTNMLAGRLEAAREDFLRTVALSEGVPAAERLLLAALNNLAGVHGHQGRYKQAAETFARTLELTEARLGPAHPTVGSNHLGLGVTYSRLEDHERAMHHVQKAVEIYEQALGPEHPDLGRGFHNLALVQAARGDTGAAYESYRHALEIKTKALGADHTSVAATANNLGDVLMRLGRPEEALPHLEDALRIGTHAYGRDNPNNVFVLTSMAEVNLALGRPAEAVPFIRRAIALAEAAQLDPTELAKARFVAARALWRAGEDRREALELARLAEVGYRASERPSEGAIEAIAAFLTDPA